MRYRWVRFDGQITEDGIAVLAMQMGAISAREIARKFKITHRAMSKAILRICTTLLDHELIHPERLDMFKDFALDRLGLFLDRREAYRRRRHA